MTHEWCPICCTPFENRHVCAGSLLATGHERHAWRVHVETPYGLQAFGVLIAPSDDLWRARILTYPNALWTTPGGGSSVKFAGRSPEEAERSAVRFVREHIADNGYRTRDQLNPLEARRVFGRGPRSRPNRQQASTRKSCVLAVRFGSERPVFAGATVNLSREGLFVSTPKPLEAGASVRLHLDVGSRALPLRGIVIWNRRNPAPGRPLGMGIRLVDPAPGYPRYVDQLAA
jgi:Tfp pilus assembly protein PilZ